MCFVAGTTVLTVAGLQAIEDIKVGDSVWAANPETGEFDYKNVVRTFVNEATELTHVTVDGEEIVSTPEHPYYVEEKGWVNAGELEVGDSVTLADGSTSEVESIETEELEEPVKVYNFEVEGYHTYFVGTDVQVLVHNSCTANPNELTATHGQTMSNNQLANLADDISANGIQETIKYVEQDGIKYIVDGHHRVLASQALGMSSVPVQQVSLPYAGYSSANDLFNWDIFDWF